MFVYNKGEFHLYGLCMTSPKSCGWWNGQNKYQYTYSVYTTKFRPS